MNKTIVLLLVLITTPLIGSELTRENEATQERKTFPLKKRKALSDNSSLKASGEGSSSKALSESSSSEEKRAADASSEAAVPEIKSPKVVPLMQRYTTALLEQSNLELLKPQTASVVNLLNPKSREEIFMVIWRKLLEVQNRCMLLAAENAALDLKEKQGEAMLTILRTEQDQLQAAVQLLAAELKRDATQSPPPSSEAEVIKALKEEVRLLAEANKQLAESNKASSCTQVKGDIRPIIISEAVHNWL